MKDFLANNLTLILTYLFGGGSLVGWILERKSRKTKEKQDTIDTVKSMQEAYNTFTTDLVKRYEDLKEEVIGLKDELENVSKQLTEERKKRLQLEEELLSLQGGDKE